MIPSGILDNRIVEYSKHCNRRFTNNFQTSLLSDSELRTMVYGYVVHPHFLEGLPYGYARQLGNVMSAMDLSPGLFGRSEVESLQSGRHKLPRWLQP